MYTMEYYSAIKKNEIMLFAAKGMEIMILSKVSQKEKDKYRMISLMESKKQHKRTYLQNKNRLTDIVNRLVVAKGEGRWGREGLGVWD